MLRTIVFLISEKVCPRFIILAKINLGKPYDYYQNRSAVTRSVTQTSTVQYVPYHPGTPGLVHVSNSLIPMPAMLQPSLPQHVFPPTNGAQPAVGVPPPVGVSALNAPNPPFSSNSAISRGPQILPQFNSMTSSRVHYQTNSGHPPADHHRYINISTI